MKPRIIAAAAVVAATATLFAVPAAAQVTKASAPGIVNYSRVDSVPGFGGSPAGFGGATEPSAMAWLKNQGFVTVINLRLASEQGAEVEASRAAAEAAGLEYVHLPFDTANPDPQLVDDFLAAVGESANQPVYIHCRSANRVAALWMIARVLKDGWEIDRASAEAELIALKPAPAIAFATAYLASLED